MADPFTPSAESVTSQASSEVGVDSSQIQREAIGIVRREATTWETATAFITDRVAFQMRTLIKQLRKNYWGVFDEQIDPSTGRRKIWIPLTESTVESVVKNIDLDTKDINFRAKKPDKARLTSLVRTIVKNYLDDTYFGESLDDLERRLAIDGTAVWKTYKTKPKNKNDADMGIKRVPVDLLNCYIDPTSSSIREAYRFTERGLQTQEEVEGMASEGWLNTKDIVGTYGLPRTDNMMPLSAGAAGSTTKYVDVWELWGKISKYLITGIPEDRLVEIDGHIICSGLDKGTDLRCHLIESYDGEKPYEEAWYTRVPGRWYGKGIAEKLIWLQLWINTIINIRINRSYVQQLGLFKVKRNAGVTPQMLSRLTANGVVLVNNMDDVQQMAIQEASMASYKDEDIIQGWAEKVTSAFEVVTGEQLPASTPATNAVLQNRNAQSQFVLIKEGVGMFLQRWIGRQLLPRLRKEIKAGDIIRQTGDPEFLRSFDECYVDNLLANRVQELTDEGKYVDGAQVLAERERILAQLRVSGKDRHIKLEEDIPLTDYDVQVYITNEEIDKGVLSQNLLAALEAAPEYKDQILTSIFDIMGVGPFIARPQLPPQLAAMVGAPGAGAPPGPAGAVGPIPTQNPVAQVAAANTL